MLLIFFVATKIGIGDYQSIIKTRSINYDNKFLANFILVQIRAKNAKDVSSYNLSYEINLLTSTRFRDL